MTKAAIVPATTTNAPVPESAVQFADETNVQESSDFLPEVFVMEYVQNLFARSRNDHVHGGNFV
jgi:hypothetical protein